MRASYGTVNIVSDTDLRTAAKKVTEYLNNQGENKPVETPPYEFREWEPKVKKFKGIIEEMKREANEYLMEKYGSIIQMDEDGRVVQIDKDGNVTELSEEPKDEK